VRPAGEEHQHLDRAGVVDRLRLTPLFGGLTDDQLDRLVEMGEIVDLAPGEALIREGDEADALYVVLDGELDVTKRSGRTDIPLARVGPGSLQGEIAALEGGRRLASVHGRQRPGRGPSHPGRRRPGAALGRT
jgi:CRP-like cAMP-binding protein